MKSTRMPFIGWRDDHGRLRLHGLDALAGPATIGRAPASSITLGWDSKVSSLHAELIPLGGEWLIADDGLSKNGTYVGGERLTSRRRLRDEDRILVGATVLVFHAGDTRPTDTELDSSDVVRRSDLSKTELMVLESLCAPLVLDAAEEPAPNEQIAAHVFLTVDGVKRCLTRLYTCFGVVERPKRTRLAKRAISTGVVSRRHYEDRG